VGGTASAAASTVCLNQGTTINLTGNSGAIQWQRSENSGSTWANISGANASSYVTPDLITDTYYRAIVSNGSCATANSSVASVSLTEINQSNASATTYNSGWTTGQNDSTTGFGAWNLSTVGGTAGFFTGTSDVNNGGTRSWGMYASGGSNVASAIRPVTMNIGNTVSFSMDHGLIDSGKVIGFGLQNNTGQNLMEIIFIGGQSFYTMNDNAGGVSTSIGYTTTGLDISITYAALNTYSITITSKDGAKATYTARTFSTQTGGQIPSQIRFFNAGAGSGSSYDMFFNSLTINNPVITTQPSTTTQTLCQLSTPTNISVVASGTGITYQWYSNSTKSYSAATNLGSANNAQTATLTPQTATAGTLYYYCIVTGSCGATYSDFSGAVQIDAASVGGTVSSPQTICSGSQPSAD
jgi:hypothetical protein